MNQELNNYESGPGELSNDGYGRMSDMPMSQYSSYNRMPYMDNMSNDYGSQGYGQYQHSGNRGGYSGPTRPSIGGSRSVSVGSSMGMMQGQAYSTGQQRMMSGQCISQQSGPTPTLNQLLQNPNSQRYSSNNYDGYNGPHKGMDVGSANGQYGMTPCWTSQNQRGMGNYPSMSMPGSSPYRGQVRKRHVLVPIHCVCFVFHIARHFIVVNFVI